MVEAINIADITNEFDKFALAKFDIEKMRIDSKAQKEPLNLIGFIESLEAHSKVYMHDANEMIPYNCIKVPSSGKEYVFYYSVSSKSKGIITKYAESFANGEIALKEVSTEELASEGKYRPEFPYVLIGSNNYAIVPK